MTAQRRQRTVAAADRCRHQLAELHVDLTGLAARADALGAELRQQAGDDDHLLGVRAALDHAAGQLRQVADELAWPLYRLLRLAEVLGDPTSCGLPWGVCPRCLGQGLASSARWSQCPRCRRRWPDLEVEPCPWPAAATVTDRDGERLRLCASHATDAARRLAGAHVAWDRGGGGGR